MSKLTLENLENCFLKAINSGAEYVAVAVKMQNQEDPEVIINSKRNFTSKLNYYSSAYNDNLTLNSFNSIQIVGFTFGNTFEEIERDLMK